MKNKKMRYALISVAMILSLIFALIVPAAALVTDVVTGKEFEDNKNLAKITLPEVASFGFNSYDIKSISPDGKMFLTSESLWDIEYNQKLFDVDYDSAAFYPDSSKLITHRYGIGLSLIDLNTLKTIKTVKNAEYTIIGVTGDSKNIVAKETYRFGGEIYILDSATLEQKSSFSPGSYDASFLNDKTNQIALLISPNQDRDENDVIVKIYDISGKMLTNKKITPPVAEDRNYTYYTHHYYMSNIIYFDNEYICFKGGNNYPPYAIAVLASISGNEDTVISYCYDSFTANVILPLHDDLYLAGDEVINLKTKTVVAKLSANPEIFKILPDKKQGVGRNGIYDMSLLLRKVTNIELSVPEYVEVGYSQPLSVTVSFDDNTKQTLKYGEYEITSSNVRTLFIDNDGTVSARNTGTITLTAEYFGFTVEKKIQVTVLPTKLTAKTVGKTIELSWLKPSATNISGYYVYRTTEKGKYSDTPLHDIPVKSDVLTFADNQVEPDKQYYYTYKLVFADGTLSPASNEVAAIVTTNRTLAMQINNPNMVINENEYVEVDPGRGTVPVIKNNRTLVPIRAIIEAFGGTVEWNGDEREIVMTLGENTVTMWLNSHKALVNGEEKTLDVAPEIFNDRTFVPVRFVTENLKLNVEWEATHSLIVISEKPIQNILECAEVKKLLNP